MVSRVTEKELCDRKVRAVLLLALQEGDVARRRTRLALRKRFWVALWVGGATDLELRPAITDEANQVAGIGESIRMRAETALPLRRVAAQSHDGRHVLFRQPVEDSGEIHLRMAEASEMRHGVQPQIVLQRRHQVHGVFARTAASTVSHRDQIHVQTCGFGQRRIQPRPAFRRLGRKEFKRNGRVTALKFFEKGHGCVVSAYRMANPDSKSTSIRTWFHLAKSRQFQLRDRYFVTRCCAAECATSRTGWCLGGKAFVDGEFERNRRLFCN